MESEKEGLNLTFTPRVWKSGTSWVVTIPIEWIKKGYLEKGDLPTFKVIDGLRHPKQN